MVVTDFEEQIGKDIFNWVHSNQYFFITNQEAIKAYWKEYLCSSG